MLSLPPPMWTRFFNGHKLLHISGKYEYKSFQNHVLCGIFLWIGVKINLWLQSANLHDQILWINTTHAHSAKKNSFKGEFGNFQTPKRTIKTFFTHTPLWSMGLQMEFFPSSFSFFFSFFPLPTFTENAVGGCGSLAVYAILFLNQVILYSQCPASCNDTLGISW